MQNFCRLKYYVTFYFALFRIAQTYASCGIFKKISSSVWSSFTTPRFKSVLYLLIFVSIKEIGMEGGCWRCTWKWIKPKLTKPWVWMNLFIQIDYKHWRCHPGLIMYFDYFFQRLICISIGHCYLLLNACQNSLVFKVHLQNIKRLFIAQYTSRLLIWPLG